MKNLMTIILLSTAIQVSALANASSEVSSLADHALNRINYNCRKYSQVTVGEDYNLDGYLNRDEEAVKSSCRQPNYLRSSLINFYSRVGTYRNVIIQFN